MSYGKNMVKNMVKNVLPIGLKKVLKRILNRCKLRGGYEYDFVLYARHSASINIDSEEKLRGRIIMFYHMIEKGLTLPNPRLGFGKPKLLTLCGYCELYASQYGISNDQVRHAMGVMLEYVSYHADKEYALEEDLLLKISQINKLFDKVSLDSKPQITMSKEEFFKNSKSSFDLFSESRKSVRSFSKESIDVDTINEAINLAKNAPSACNRQTARVYVFNDKKDIQKILKCQNGNSGFGEDTDTLIVVTAELGVFIDVAERNQVYIDGGLFLMNLLYALHFKNIGVCTLNCSHTPDRDIEIRKFCKINKSEVFIAMLACGMVTDDFYIARSPRQNPLKQVEK